MAYKASEDQLTGDKVMLFIHEGEDGSGADVPIAYGTSCQVEISAETVDNTSKMSGNWKESLTGQLSYTISSDSLLSMGTGHMSFAKLMSLMAAREPVKFKLGQWTESAGEYTVTGPIVEGSGVITSLSMTAGLGNEVCSASFTMTGTGELVDSSGAAAAAASAQASVPEGEDASATASDQGGESV